MLCAEHGGVIHKVSGTAGGHKRPPYSVGRAMLCADEGERDALR